ncbi:glucose-1-phosphate cytidylyltransferase [Elusimicrobiota bacterium]
MQTVILCGGLGTRLREETEYRPKPMVGIGQRPILWHIMKSYSHFNNKEFVLCLGYKGNKIKEYFLNYHTAHRDFSIKLEDEPRIHYHSISPEEGWQVTLSETGLETQTGARLKKIEKYITNDNFMVTYGDGVANVDIKKLIAFHARHGKIATVTGVRSASRFGELLVKDRKVKEFTEKPRTSQGYINGGFFVFSKKIFKWLSANPKCSLEKGPLSRLAKQGQMMMYPHDGFWQCMDTYRDLQYLQQLWKNKKAPWKVWKD